MNTTELARREQRAQHGIIEFAEEMQAIRDGKLYPNAGETNKGKIEPWNTYCVERWGMSDRRVDAIIAAMPVLRRRSRRAAARATSVSAATEVASLPEAVQDEVLDNTETRNEVREKAKAVRKEAKRIETQEGREATEDELVEVAKQTPKPKRKPKPKLKDSKFTHALEMAYYEIERAANIANSDVVLTDVENEYGWNRVGKIEYELGRLKDRLTRPDYVRDLDEDAAVLLGGEQR